MQSILHSAGYPGSYSGHSFGIGAATTATKAAGQGVPDHLIKTLSWWSSHAYQLYIRTPICSLTQISCQLAQQVGGPAFFEVRLGASGQVSWGQWRCRRAPVAPSWPILEVLSAWWTGLVVGLQVGRVLGCSGSSSPCSSLVPGRPTSIIMRPRR